MHIHTCLLSPASYRFCFLMQRVVAGNTIRIHMAICLVSVNQSKDVTRETRAHAHAHAHAHTTTTTQTSTGTPPTNYNPHQCRQELLPQQQQPRQPLAWHDPTNASPGWPNMYRAPTDIGHWSSLTGAGPGGATGSEMQSPLKTPPHSLQDQRLCTTTGQRQFTSSIEGWAEGIAVLLYVQKCLTR